MSLMEPPQSASIGPLALHQPVDMGGEGVG